jgi:hypothetical protein
MDNEQSVTDSLASLSNWGLSNGTPRYLEQQINKALQLLATLEEEENNDSDDNNSNDES